MNGSWVQLTGTVTDLTFAAGAEDFVRTPGGQGLAIGAAAALAAEGLAGAAAGASMVAMAADDVEYFECKINGHAVAGRFSKVSFKNGDTLSMVAKRQPGHGDLIVAAHRLHDQKIWMAPHCSRGTRAHAGLSLKLFFGLWLALLVLLGGAFALMDYFTNEPITPTFRIFWISLVSGLALIMSAYYAVRFYRQWLPLARQFDAVFAALGYAHPAAVDLPREHARYCKRRGDKWPYATEGSWIYHVAP